MQRELRTVPGRIARIAVGGLLLASSSFLGHLQDPAPAADRVVDGATRREVIEGALKQNREHYPYPDAASAIERALHEHLAKGEYDRVTSGAELARLLNEHIQAVHEDPHLRVEFTASPGSSNVRSNSPTATLTLSAEEQRK